MIKVLIIEDEDNLREVYQEEFASENFEVQSANNGVEGLNKIKSFLPHIVLLDLLMPQKSGFDVLEQVKKDPALKTIPIVVITNIYADTQDLVQNWGAKHVLLKVDYTPGQLVAKVREILSV